MAETKKAMASNNSVFLHRANGKYSLKVCYFHSHPICLQVLLVRNKLRSTWALKLDDGVNLQNGSESLNPDESVAHNVSNCPVNLRTKHNDAEVLGAPTRCNSHFVLIKCQHASRLIDLVRRTFLEALPLVLAFSKPQPTYSLEGWERRQGVTKQITSRVAGRKNRSASGAIWLGELSRGFASRACAFQTSAYLQPRTMGKKTRGNRVFNGFSRKVGSSSTRLIQQQDGIVR